MSLALLMDAHIHGGVTAGLRAKGFDVVAAREENLHELDDEELLDEATRRGRVLVTHDQDFLKIAAERQRSGAMFIGIVFGPATELPVGKLIADLELIALVQAPGDLLSRVEYLPL